MMELLVPVGNSVAECCVWVCEVVRLMEVPDVAVVVGEEHDQDGCGYVARDWPGRGLIVARRV